MLRSPCITDQAHPNFDKCQEMHWADPKSEMDQFRVFTPDEKLYMTCPRYDNVA